MLRNSEHRPLFSQSLIRFVTVWFSSPLHADTGPTAWMTPIYPFLLACVFKVFGIYTKASAIFMLSLDSLFSALTSFPSS